MTIFKTDPVGGLRFSVVFHVPSKPMAGQELRLGHDRLLPHPFQFNNHPVIRRCRPTDYATCTTKSTADLTAALAMQNNSFWNSLRFIAFKVA